MYSLRKKIGTKILRDADTFCSASSLFVTSALSFFLPLF